MGVCISGVLNKLACGTWCCCCALCDGVGLFGLFGCFVVCLLLLLLLHLCFVWQLSSVVGDVNKALDFNIEPEADVDPLLELYAKLHILFAPNRQALDVATDAPLHGMDGTESDIRVCVCGWLVGWLAVWH